MSGGGGGGGSGDSDNWRPASTISNPAGGGTSGAGGTGVPNPCLFTEITNLSSPNIAVTSALSVGSVLTIVLQESPLRVLAMSAGNAAGSITSARLADIIECLRSGQQYAARVTQISGGAVTVEIYPI